MTQRATEAGGRTRRSPQGRGNGHRRPAGFLDRVSGAVNRGLRVLRAAAGALVEDQVESDALSMLAAQHRLVEKLFAGLEKGEGGSEARAAQLDELVESLVLHAAIEEAVFYPTVRTPETESLILESIEEHLAMKRTLLDLATTGVADETFPAKLSTLKEQVVHHAKQEEERKLFPLLRGLMSAEQREALAQELTAAMVEAMEGPSPRDRLRQEVG
jgi:hemerythrin superfamily protein